MTGATLAGLSEDAQNLLVTLADGDSRTQRDLALGVLGLAPHGIRRIQAAAQELRMAGWPLVSDDEGMHLEDDPVAVRACADALRRRAVTQMLTARALRATAHRMAAPMTLWPQEATA